MGQTPFFESPEESKWGQSNSSCLFLQRGNYKFLNSECRFLILILFLRCFLEFSKQSSWKRNFKMDLMYLKLFLLKNGLRYEKLDQMYQTDKFSQLFFTN